MRFKPPSHSGEGSPLPWVCGKKTPLNILSRSRHIQQTSVSARRIRILLLKRFLQNWLITLLFLLDPFIESIPCHGPNPVIGPDSYKRREDIDKYFQVRREIQLATVGNTIWLGGQKASCCLLDITPELFTGPACTVVSMVCLLGCIKKKSHFDFEIFLISKYLGKEGKW